ncbi:MAG: hypothetical protein ABFD04_14040, partial [Syntrophomonas sp.]
MTGISNKATNRLFILVSIVLITALIIPGTVLAGQDSKAPGSSDPLLSSNPLLQSFNTPGQTPPFDQIKPEHYIPALQYAISLENGEIDTIVKNNAQPTFANTIEALDRSGELVARISAILFALNAAETNPALQKAATDASLLLAAHSNDISFNQALFARIEKVYKTADRSKLTPEQRTLLE